MQAPWRVDFPSSHNPFRFFLYASKPHARVALTALSTVFVASILYAGVPYIFKRIVDAATGFEQGASYVPLLWAAGAYIVVAFIAEMLWRTSGYTGSYWATGARATARESLTAYITLHSRSYFGDRFAGALSTKISHAADGVRAFVEHFLWHFFQLFVSVIVSFIIAFWTSPLVALVFLLWICVIIPLNYVLARKRVPLSARAHRSETVLSGATVDLLTNSSVMQEYARRDFELERIRNLILDRRRLGLRNWHFGEATLVLNNILQTLFAAVMVFTTVYLAVNGRISAGDIVLIITIIFRLEEQFVFIGSNINSFAEQWGEVRESLEEILVPHDIPDHAGAVEIAVSEGAIALHAVTFGYGREAIFSDVSVSIAPHQRVGLVGRSGSGKSTLMRLLLHHYDIDAGSIEIDGQNVADVTQESLRRAIAIVPQEPMLFHRSIWDNIGYGLPNATRADIVRAAKLAQADEFIARLPEGYDSLVGERGVKLSGGERQRIAIARAILKDAPILLLDEATSALDSESEVAIQKALHNLMEGKTVIAIAHRLSTLREMDRIIVMDRGAIVEDGSHDELVRKGGIYADLWNHQAGGFIPEDE